MTRLSRKSRRPRASLSPAWLSAAVSWTGSLGPRSPPVFPASGSLLATPPFPRSGPGEPGSPTSAVLRGRYDFPSRISRSLIGFAPGSHAILLEVRARRCRRSRTAGGTAAGQDHWSAGDPHCRRLARGHESNVSGSQAIHPVPLPRSTTPAGPTSPRQWRSRRCCPCEYEHKGSSVTSISRLDLGALAPAVYASRATLPSPMQNSLPVGWLAFAGGSRTLWTAMTGFRATASLPPFLGLP